MIPAVPKAKEESTGRRSHEKAPNELYLKHSSGCPVVMGKRADLNTQLTKITGHGDGTGIEMTDSHVLFLPLDIYFELPNGYWG